MQYQDENGSIIRFSVIVDCQIFDQLDGIEAINGEVPALLVLDEPLKRGKGYNWHIYRFPRSENTFLLFGTYNADLRIIRVFGNPSKFDVGGTLFIMDRQKTDLWQEAYKRFEKAYVDGKLDDLIISRLAQFGEDSVSRFRELITCKS